MTRAVAPGGVLDWDVTLPGAARHVEVRVGQGDLLPVTTSALLIGGVPQGAQGAAARVTAGLVSEQATLYRASTPYTVTPYGVRLDPDAIRPTGNPDVYRTLLATSAAPQARFAYHVSAAAFTVRASGADLLSLIGAEGDALLVMTATLEDGTRHTQSLSVRVDGTPPTGSVSVSRAGPYVYLAYRDLSGDAVHLTAVLGDGTRVIIPRPDGERGSMGVLGAQITQTPVAVTATDDAGNESGDLLLRATTLSGDGQPTGTELAPWPLPTYLNPKRPVLGAILGAWAAALSIGADEAGHALDLREAEGRELDALCAYYGVTRLPGEVDGALMARVQARFAARKSSRAGLVRQLAAVDGGTASVADAHSRFESARTLDGTWTLDGSVQLGGSSFVENLNPGEIVVTFPREPLAGWPRATALTGRYRAAGVRAQVRTVSGMHAVTGHATRLDVRTVVQDRPDLTPTTQLTVRVYSDVLTLDGSWTLSAAETLDGTRGSTQVTEL